MAEDAGGEVVGALVLAEGEGALQQGHLLWAEPVLLDAGLLQPVRQGLGCRRHGTSSPALPGSSLLRSGLKFTATAGKTVWW